MHNGDWKSYFKQFIPTEEYIPDNIRSGNMGNFIFFALVGLIASAGLITKVESKSIDNKTHDAVYQEIQMLKTQINSLEEINTSHESEILKLNYDLNLMLENREKDEISKLSGLTGTNNIMGQGIIITLTDSEKPLQTDENPNLGIIHNMDLLELVNDLWKGKAKAVYINNQRITAMTEFTCIGPTILVNKTRIVPPFVIKAIGDPEKLSKTIEAGYIQILVQNKINYSLEKYKKIEIPAGGTIMLAGEN